MGFYPFAPAASGGSSVVDWVSVTAKGADKTGAADSTAAFQAAITALPSGAGRIYIPAGTYKISGTLAFQQGQGVIGDGADCTFLHYTGSGVLIDAVLQGTFTGAAYAGSFSGFYADGYSGGGAAVGLRVSNLQGIGLDDVSLYGFGGVGLSFLNTSGDWSEQGTLRCRLVQNGTAVIFDTGSMDYSDFDFTIVTGNGTGGITVQNGAQLQGPRLRVRGNFYGSAGNTAAVIAIDPGNVAGTSYITNADLSVSVESAGSGLGHFTLLMGSSNGASQFTGVGIFSFNPVGPAFQGYSNPGFVPVSIAGIINDPVLGSTTPGTTALMAYGQVVTNDITVNGNGNLASGNPAMFLSGASQIWQFFNDNGTKNWGVYDQTHAKLGLTLSPNTLLLTMYGGSSTAQSAPVLAPAFTSGTASQLSDTTRDYMIYMECTTAGTALTLAIGPTSTPATTIIASSTATLGELVSFRLPAGWFVKWSATAAAFATQTAIGC